MTPNTIGDYELFIYSLRQHFPSIVLSTVSVVRSSPSAGQVVGVLHFVGDITLVVAEAFDFDTGQFEIFSTGMLSSRVLNGFIGMTRNHIPTTRSWRPPILITNIYRRISNTIAFQRRVYRSLSPICHF